jgi:hypothetical protein
VEEEMMTKRSVVLSSIGSGVVCLLLTGVSDATVPRAFVSTGGSDANPCSAAQPCRSFNQALTVVEAGGEIVVQNSGGYSTGFTIAQSVTIDATGVNASVISTTATDLCTINTFTNDRVVLRGISFHGASVGRNAINAVSVGSLYVEQCSISEFTGNGISMPFGGNLWVTNTDVRKCDTGVGVASDLLATNLVLESSRFTECATAGVHLVAAGPVAATGWLNNCTASLCGTGISLQSNLSSNADLTLTNCRAFGNGNGLTAQTFSTGNATMRIANCVVTRCTSGIGTASSGGGVASVLGTSPGTNLITGNAGNNATSGTVTLQ